MSAPGPLVGFVPITEKDRARAFYTDVLGLEFVEDNGFALVLRSAAGQGELRNMIRLVPTETVAPAPFTKLGWETTQIEADVRRLAAAGVVFSRYAFLEQDGLGIWTAPDGSKVAWFTDPDGNVLSLSQD